MALKIRLSRAGAKKRPFYRIVVTNSRNPRDGRYIERLGTYDPMLPKDGQRVKLVEDRIRHWLGVGAKPTDRVARFLGNTEIIPMPAQRNNPQKAKPKPKAKAVARLEEEREKAEAAKAAPPVEEAPAEEAPAEEAPAEDAPVVEAPADEAPVEEAPVEEAPAEEAPAEEAPAAEATDEGSPEGGEDASTEKAEKDAG